MISYSVLQITKIHKNLSQLDRHIFETAERENRVITNAGHFPTFLYQTVIHVLLPMIKYSFFKNHRFLRRLLIPSEDSFNFYPSIALLSYLPKTGGY